MTILKSVDKAGYTTYVIKIEDKSISTVEITDNCFKHNAIGLIFYLKGIGYRCEFTHKEAFEISNHLKKFIEIEE